MCFSATCYVLHIIPARLEARGFVQKKAWTVMYHSCLTLMLTQQSSGAGLPLKVCVDSPHWDVSTSPRSPVTRRYNTSRHQGAFALFLCASRSLSPLSRRSRATNPDQPSINTSLQVCRRCLSAERFLESYTVAVLCISVCSFCTIWFCKHEALCRHRAVFAGDANRIRWSRQQWIHADKAVI